MQPGPGLWASVSGPLPHTGFSGPVARGTGYPKGFFYLYWVEDEGDYTPPGSQAFPNPTPPAIPLNTPLGASKTTPITTCGMIYTIYGVNIYNM